jgi:hypothetical protein
MSTEPVKRYQQEMLQQVAAIHDPDASSLQDVSVRAMEEDLGQITGGTLTDGNDAAVRRPHAQVLENVSKSLVHNSAVHDGEKSNTSLTAVNSSPDGHHESS